MFSLSHTCLKPHAKYCVYKQALEKTAFTRGLEAVQGTSLVVQWLRFQAPNAGGLGSVPGGGSRFLMKQLKILMLQLRSGAAK